MEIQYVGYMKPSCPVHLTVLLRRLVSFAVCLAVVFWVAFTPGRADADEGEPELRFGTLELHPYGWEDPDGSRHGLVYDYQQAIGERTGLRFTNEIIPFARTLDMLEGGQLDVITAQPHDEALAAGDRLMVLNRMNVVVGTTKRSGIHSFDDLRGRRLMYILDTSYPALKDLPESIYRVKNYRTMLMMLHDRPAVDGGVFSEPAYYYWMKKLQYSPKEFGPAILVETRDDWAFVRKDLPEEIREKLRRAIASLQAEKFYEGLLEELKRETAH
jgi:ABC-type amino acid transport substrate-binding protein